MIAVCVAEWSAVVHNTPLIFAWNLHHRMVSGTGGYRRILLQDFVDALEWPQW